MKDWRTAIVHKDKSLLAVIEAINKSTLQVALIVDTNETLLGLLTDGDVRRAILADPTLNRPASSVLLSQFVSARKHDSSAHIATLMRKYDVKHIPILDENGRILDLKTLDELLWHNKLDNTVVIMAGGLGTRLRPLTENLPKPLVQVHGKPILEHILRRLAAQGFHNIYISVNYLADKIIDYFGDGSNSDLNIQYIRESSPLGTAGSLSLLPHHPEASFLVMNADLLTHVDNRQLLEFHTSQDSVASMGVRSMEYQIPYGVVSTKMDSIVSIEEKPTHSFLVNAGVYALAPEVLRYISPEEVLDMPDLFRRLIEDGHRTKAFALHEDWIDIGRPTDLSRACAQPEREIPE